ncbi:MAG TPA: DNA primase [Parvibaculum sp.]|uniref:DNA primase n=1 Tax=Parvibaculum sp. TaxID=2024848 RepID=UPI002CFFF931|nr:DNA primase [Parvibaculum sp.]HMM15837.1 DNA primase [Parvibaculum sp.]
MSFPKSFLDELKARIRVSEVVGRKVKLTRRGREFVGLSPFTNEKTPSFTVNDDKQFFHCFSSGEHGDIIKFLEKTENLSFIEAVERLAAEAGMEMPQRDQRSVERAKEEASLIDIMEMAAAYFRDKLAAGAGAEARSYLDRRGLKRETIERFGIGYAPDDRHGLIGYLTAKGVRLAQMAEAGLIIAGADIPEPYDRFRNRVMFPIGDARGRTIAFGGRALDPNAKAKYLNSPETPLFHKGRGLYNLHRARKPAYDAGTVIAVEGYMDVIGLAQAGFENVVAPLGTALTEDQIGLMWRLAPEPILCFDGDKAGLGAAFRAMQRARPLLKAGHSFRFALMAAGKDPDDLVREEGASSFREILAEAKSLPEMVFSELLLGERLQGPDDRARLEKKLAALIAEISDETVRKHYQRTLNDWLWNHFADVFGWRRKSERSRNSKPDLVSAESARNRRLYLLEYRLEAEILAYLFAAPSLVSIYFDPLNCLDLEYRQHQSILAEIVQFCGQHEQADADDLIKAISGRGLDARIEEILNSTAHRVACGLDVTEIEAKFLATLALFVLRGQYSEINRDALALNGDSDAMQDYFDRILWLAKELQLSAMAGDDSAFFKIAEGYRSRIAKPEEFRPKMVVNGR